MLAAVRLVRDARRDGNRFARTNAIRTGDSCPGRAVEQGVEQGVERKVERVELPVHYRLLPPRTVVATGEKSSEVANG